MSTTPEDQHARVLAAMHAAIEYARVQHSGMATQHTSTAAGRAAVGAALDAIRADCEAVTPELDLTGALATITLRAATLACQASGAAGHLMTVPQFLDELERELTPPDDLSGLR